MENYYCFLEGIQTEQTKRLQTYSLETTESVQTPQESITNATSNDELLGENQNTKYLLHFKTCQTYENQTSPSE